MNENFKQNGSDENNNELSQNYQILIFIYCIICFITSFFELPPTSYLIRFYSFIFNTDEYSPMLTASLMILLVLIPILYLRKRNKF